MAEKDVACNNNVNEDHKGEGINYVQKMRFITTKLFFRELSRDDKTVYYFVLGFVKWSSFLTSVLRQQF